MKMPTIKELKDKYSKLAQYLIALLAGSIILFPTLFGAFNPPYILDGAMYGFWGFAVLGFILLGVAFYLATFVENNVPHVLTGLGNLSTLVALVCLAVFIGGNVFQDRTGQPTITKVISEPIVARRTQWIKLSAEAHDDDRDLLKWKWSISSEPIKKGVNPDFIELGDRQVSYWKIPASAKIGEYIARVEVSDDEDDELSLAQVSVFVEDESMVMKSGSESELLRAYVSDRVSLETARIIRDDVRKSELLTKASKLLVDKAVENLTSLAAVQDDKDSLTEALRAYISIPEKELSEKGFLPCCSQYPGIFPFCDRGC